MIKHSYLLFLVLAVGCNKSLKISEPAPFSNSVPTGSSFHIPLPENHTSGYMWQMANTYDANTLEYINSVWHGNEKGVVFNFESKAKGSTELEFSLIKYKDTLEVKKFLIDVK